MDNFYGVTIEDMKVAITKGYMFTVSVQNGFVFNKNIEVDTATVWKVQYGWQSARLDKHNIYENHKIFDYLQDALKREW